MVNTELNCIIINKLWYLLMREKNKIYVAVLRRRHIHVVNDEGMKMSMNGGYEFPGCGRMTGM